MKNTMVINHGYAGDDYMPIINVAVTPNFMQKYARVNPIDALNEIIWNALDADATEVQVEFIRDELESIEKIIVSDNGHGIYFKDVSRAFGNLGNSLKTDSPKTPGGREYHGRNGEGRYKALSLGTKITWDSVYIDEDRKKRRYSITFNSTFPNTIDISEPENTPSEIGVAVIIENIFDRASNAINNDQELAISCSREFAPYLLGYPGIQITVNGIKVSPQDAILNSVKKEFEVTLEKRLVKGEVHLIHWTDGGYNRIHMCSSQGVSLLNTPLHVQHGNLSLGVYVKSDYLAELKHTDILEFDELSPGLKEIKTIAREVVRQYYEDWQRQSIAKTIESLKKEDVYPYKGEPATKVEKVERQVFDLCTAKVHEIIPDFSKTPNKQKKLTLRLLKESLRQRPSELEKILIEVLDLNDVQIKEFSEILEKTSLSAIISTTKMVSDRLRFLNGLDQIVFSSDYSCHLKERSQLHKILVQELWVFGEHYSLGCDDIRLSNVLKEYSSFLGRPDLAAELSESELNDLNDIPDVCLWSQYSMGRPDEVENLVVELKRPSVKIGYKEINQITTYARKVAEHPRFPKDKTRWNFLIVSRDLDDNIHFAMTEKKDGCYVNTGNVSIYVKDWGQIINEATARYKYLQQNLDIAVDSNTEGMSLLLQKYSALLPNAVKDIAASIEN